MLNALRKTGFDAAFKCCISKNSFRLVGYCFVDDSTMVRIAPTPDTPTEHMVELAQEQVDLYEALAHSTGGQVSPVLGKNLWYLIELKWHPSGKWSLVNNEAVLTVNTTARRVPIQRLPTTSAHKILGVWMSPSSDSAAQIKHLRKITEAWADRIQSGHLPPSNA
eukprot:6320712-Ditylum_brightwellii.AAC.2